jgi:hypothetical protein
MNFIFFRVFWQKVDWIQNKLERPFFKKLKKRRIVFIFDIEVVFPGIKNASPLHTGTVLVICPKQFGALKIYSRVFPFFLFFLINNKSKIIDNNNNRCVVM